MNGSTVGGRVMESKEAPQVVKSLDSKMRVVPNLYYLSFWNRDSEKTKKKEGFM